MNIDISVEHPEDGYDSSSSSESTPRNSYNPSPTQGFAAYTGPVQHSTTIEDYLMPSLSRGSTPFSASSSSSASDSESESNSPFLRSHRRRTRRSRPAISWWHPPRRQEFRLWRPVRRCARNTFRSPFCPTQPLYIVLALVVFCIFAVILTLLLMYILNPDKQPLPWRAYCSVPPASLPPPYVLSSPSSFFQISQDELTIKHDIFPPPHFDSLPPAGVFIGVFSMDSSFERRMLIRSTYATHPRSRGGAGDGDGGAGTSRTIVRFVMGLPRKDWDRRIRLEMETYNDIVVLPIPENMNNGKTHSFFTWAASHAWVPPQINNGRFSAAAFPTFSYSNESIAPPPLAPHDPIPSSGGPDSPSSPWVRPDFVVKVDDDAFVMLAELEGRLRNELHLKPSRRSSSSSSSSLPTEERIDNDDPLIYWGYLVTNRLHRFMAGELYGLSWRLVSWIATDPTVKTMVNGAEDKQTSKWMRLHPRATDVRWSSERCWIYDHPRAGSVYAHGFLFPSERSRIQKNIMEYSEHTAPTVAATTTTTRRHPSLAIPLSGNEISTPSEWAQSSVSTFRTRYEPPMAELSVRHSVEAMVEGSAMSTLRHGAPSTPEFAWSRREGRQAQYESRRLGGTIVVHYIKKHMWFMETALALLEGDEFTEAEQLTWRDGQGEGSSDNGNSSSTVSFTPPSTEAAPSPSSIPSHGTLMPRNVR